MKDNSLTFNSEITKLENYLTKKGEEEKKNLKEGEFRPAEQLASFLNMIKELRTAIQDMTYPGPHFDHLKAFMKAESYICGLTDTSLHPNLKETIDKYYEMYSYKEAFEPEMQLMNSLYDTINNLRDVYDKEIISQEATNISTSLNEIATREKALEDNKVTFINTLQKIGADSSSFDSDVNIAKGKQSHIEKQIEALKNTEEQNKINDNANKKVKELKSKIDTIEKDINYYVKWQNNVSLIQVELMKRELDLKAAESKIEANLLSLENRNKALEIVESNITITKARVEEYNKAEKVLNDLKKDKESFESYKKAAKLNERALNLQSAFYNLNSMVNENIDIRESIGLSFMNIFKKKDSINLNRYYEAKKTILESFSDNPEETKELERIFTNCEKNKNIPFPQSFVSQMEERVKNQSAKLIQDAEKYSKVYNEYQNTMQPLLEKMEENKDSKDMLNSYELEKKSILNEIEQLNKSNKDNSLILEDMNKRFYNAMEPDRKDKKPMLYQDMVVFSQDQYNKLGIQITTKKNDPEYAKLKEDKLEQEQIFNKTTSKGLANQIKDLKTIKKTADDRVNIFTKLQNEKNILKRSMITIAHDKANLYDANKDLLKLNPYAQIQKRFEKISIDILKKPNKNPPEMSPEFQRFYNAIENVRDNIANPNYKESKEDLLKEAQAAAKYYIGKKEDQWRPKFWATEQRFVRLNHAKEVDRYLDSAIDLIKNLTAQEKKAFKFVSTPHHELTGDISEKFNDSLEETKNRITAENKLEKMNKNIFDDNISQNQKDIANNLNF